MRRIPSDVVKRAEKGISTDDIVFSVAVKKTHNDCEAKHLQLNVNQVIQ